MPKKDFTITKEVTERFLLLMEEVLKDFHLNRKSFADKIGRGAQNLTPLESGEQAPTLEQIIRACTEFGYSANWLLLNVGPKKLDKKEAEPLENRVSDLEAKIRKLERLFQQAFSTKAAANTNR